MQVPFRVSAGRYRLEGRETAGQLCSHELTSDDVIRPARLFGYAALVSLTVLLRSHGCSWRLRPEVDRPAHLELAARRLSVLLRSGRPTRSSIK
jgi:hypothetical protein